MKNEILSDNIKRSNRPTSGCVSWGLNFIVELIK